MFRPCIDLHEGRVKQIVGGTLSDDDASLRTNFVAEQSAAWFAQLYQRDGLMGGHVIMLGPGNETAAREALRAYPGGLHVGGGINLDNARTWLEAGASHVIVTSWVFRDGALDWDRLQALVAAIGKERLVLDLSCRRGKVRSPESKVQSPRSSGAPPSSTARTNDPRAVLEGDAPSDLGPPALEYFVVTDLWQKFTDLTLSRETLERLATCCDEFLIHAADVEGLCHGIDSELVAKLADWTPIPTTYAGGAKSLADLEEVTRIGRGHIDLTIGSALDIFGGSGVKYADVVAFNRRSGGSKPQVGK